jgi:penicillin-binding protein 1A
MKTDSSTGTGLSRRQFLAATALTSLAVALPSARVFAQTPAAPSPFGTMDKSLSSDQLSELLVRPQVIVSRGPGDELRTRWHVPLFMKKQDIPRVLKNMIVAVEDKRFYERSSHFDTVGIVRAVYRRLLGGRTEGASTIQQQLLKNLLLGGLPALVRKFDEIFVFGALLNSTGDKDDILTAYINWAPYRSGAIGMEAAALTYFRKHLAELNDFEMATLVAMLKSPGQYDPDRHPRESRERATLVLDKLVAKGWMTPARRADALKRGVRPGTSVVPDIDVGYFFDDFVRPFVGRLEGPGPWRFVLSLDVYSQIAAQAAVRQAVKEGTQRGATQGALIAIDSFGRVLANVGGRSYRESQWSRTARMRRDAGSTAKLFPYLAAIEAGRSPGSRIMDAPIQLSWPRNSDHIYRGSITLQEAFAQSRNAAAVQLTNQVGLERVIQLAARFGIRLPEKAGLEIALGNFGVTPLEMAQAYAVIANGGHRVAADGIVGIIGNAGNVIRWLAPATGVSIVRPAHLKNMSALLTAVVSSGTGRQAAMPFPVMGKTGTTSDYRDAWFIGIANGQTVSIWVGNDAFEPMDAVSGGTLPALTFQRYLSQQPRLSAPASHMTPSTNPTQRFKIPPAKTADPRKGPSGLGRLRYGGILR